MKNMLRYYYGLLFDFGIRPQDVLSVVRPTIVPPQVLSTECDGRSLLMTLIVCYGDWWQNLSCDVKGNRGAPASYRIDDILV